MTATATRPHNPYVGPRAFRPGEPIHGRDEEIAQLLDLLLAERIVLLHSPSGAGKTSLIQAALLDRLTEEGFEVLPTIRVNSRSPADDGRSGPGNRYVLSTLMSLEQGVPPDDRRPVAELAASSLDRYLTERKRTADNPVLIFDQLEEVLADPADQPAKREFFDDLALALRNRERWALLIMRDDYVAAAEPYLKVLPTRARTRFRLDFLGEHAARLAVRAPADEAGVPFTDGAVTKVIDDLRQVWVPQMDGTSVCRPGPHVEPMQLQVVCLQLWERLRPDQVEIGESDITSEGDVDSALSTYYADQVAATAAATGVTERVIRDWVDGALVVDGMFRGQTRDGPQATSGDRRAVLPLLENAHLIRAEPRLGATWFELAHDRLVAPLLADNTRWRQQHLHALQRQAALWAEANRPDGLLLGLVALAEGERWAAAHPDELTALDREFLDACRRNRTRVRRRRARTRVLIALSTTALLFACVAGYYWQKSGREARVATTNELVATARADLDLDPRQSIDDGLRALRASPDKMTDGIRDVLYQGLDSTRLLSTLHDPEAGTVYSDVAMSQDGTLLATGRTDGSVAVWDLRSRQVAFTVPSDGSAVAQVAFGPGRLLAVSTGTGLALWDVAAQRLLRAVNDGTPPTDLAVDRTGDRVAAVGEDGVVRVWDTKDGAPILSSARAAVPLRAVAFDASGTRLATGGDDGAVTVWNLATAQPVRTIAAHDDHVLSVAFSPHDDLLLTASLDFTAKIWNVGTGELLSTLSGHANTVFWAGFTPDQARVATASADGTAKVWDTATGQLLMTLTGHRTPLAGAAFDPTGRTLYTAAWDGTVRSWDSSVFHTAPVFGLAYNPSGTVLATASGDRTAVLWDFTQGTPGACDAQSRLPRPQRTLAGNAGAVNAVRFSPDGTRLVTVSTDKTAKIVDVASGRVLQTFAEHHEQVWAADWSPRGDLVATVSPGVTFIWSPTTGQVVHKLVDNAMPGDQMNAVAFGADGSWLVTAGQNGNVDVWDTASGTLRNRFTPHSQYIFAIAASPKPGSTLVATASLDHTTTLMDAMSGKDVGLPFADDDAVVSVAFSPDGNELATGSWDRTARVWDVASQQERLKITHSAQVSSVTFAPDGRHLATATLDGGVHLYDLDDDALVAMATCRAAAG